MFVSGSLKIAEVTAVTLRELGSLLVGGVTMKQRLCTLDIFDIDKLVLFR